MKNIKDIIILFAPAVGLGLLTYRFITHDLFIVIPASLLILLSEADLLKRKK